MPPLSMKEIDDAIDDAGYDEDGYDDDYDSFESMEDEPQRSMYAVLTPERRVREVPMEEWVKYFMASTRRVAYSNLSGTVVSTTFLGINLGYGSTRPLWFETMVFGGGLDGFCERYATLDEALAGHESVVITIREAARDAAKSASRHQVERVRRNNVVR